MKWFEAHKLVEAGMARYKERHLKWWKRMDGTPILNDLPCVIAEVISEATEPADASPAGDRELDLYDEIECDLPYLFGRASIEGHESGQRLAVQVKAKMRKARAALAQPAAPVAQPGDPMNWPLPCDITVGHGTMRKGVKLSTLVRRMKVLYKMATGLDADEVANRSPEERQAIFDASPLSQFARRDGEAG